MPETSSATTYSEALRGSEQPATPTRNMLLPIFLIVLVDVFGMTLVLPLMAIYAESLKASPFQATMLVSVYAACQLFSGPVIGNLSDRFGRKPLLVISQIGTLIGFIIMARAHTLWVLYLARVIDGSTAGNLTTAQAYISDNSPPEKRVKAFGLIGISFGVGFFLGPALSGVLSHHYGLTAPIWAAAGMSFCSIMCTTFLLPHGIPPQRGAQDDPGPGGKRVSVFHPGAYLPYFMRPGLSSLLIQFFFHMLCFSMFISGFALFAERRFGWGVRETGFLFAYVGFLAIIMQGGLLARMAKRFGEMPMVVSGFISLVIGYALLSQAQVLWFLIVVTTISSYGNSVLRPVITSLITKHAARYEQGIVIGITQTMMSIASIIAPGIAGKLIEHGHLDWWAYCSAAAAAAGLVIALVSYRQDAVPVGATAEAVGH